MLQRKLQGTGDSIYLEDLTHFGRTREDFSDKVCRDWHPKD